MIGEQIVEIVAIVVERKKSLEDMNEESGLRWERWLLQDEHSLKETRGKAVQTMDNVNIGITN